MSDHARGSLTVRDQVWRWGARTYVMGIINATPDSFSGDGLLGATDWLSAAVAQGAAFAAAGADCLDIGGELTRPGAAVVAAAEEAARVVPLIAALRAAVAVPISVDTWKAPVAAAALAAGADLVNDVWGLRLPDGGWNAGLAALVAARGVPIVLMHNRRAVAARGARGSHYQPVHYTDLLGDISADLQASIAYAESHGIRRSQIIVDPGVGFGKSPVQNLELLRRLHELRALNLPLLLGTLRKSFIGLVLDAPADRRVEGTAATVALGIQSGADIVRVHDVAPLVPVARMSDAIVRGWSG